MRTIAMIVGLFVTVTELLLAAPPDELQPIHVGKFPQEFSSAFSTNDGLPSDDVYAIELNSKGDVFAGTARGLAQFDGRRWQLVSGVPEVPIRGLAADGATVCVATDKAMYRVGGEKPVERLGDSPRPTTALAAANGVVWHGTEKLLYELSQKNWVPDKTLGELMGEKRAIRQLAPTADGQLLVAAESGLFLGTKGNWKRLLPQQGDRSWAVRDVRGAAVDEKGRLWFASPQGVGCFDGKWKLYTGRDGLPYNDFTCVVPGKDGVVWFGTRHGAIRFDGRNWSYREGRRWLPDNDVRDIAVTPDGNAWFATAKGVGLIERRPITLAEKAKFFEDEIDKYHRRTPFGYVMSVRLEKPGDKSRWHQRDDDNDGQWTGEYGAAQCFAYAVTKDPLAKKRAKAAFEALRFLCKVTQGGSHPAPTGFPARTILPTDGPRNPNTEKAYSVARDEERRKKDVLWKVIQPRWPTSADGKWYWKCDTSSDELDGHYFLYARYYDLVADTEAEKERVREVVREITDHLLENDFKLIDHDGKPTRWANFSPGSLNNDAAWWAGRGLNSLSILGHLRAAEHITGDSKYGDAADNLAIEHAFAMNVMYPKQQRGPGSFVQFDDEMAFLNYYNLIMYEKNPKLREMFTLSCHDYWELENPERNSFFNFAFAALCRGETVSSPWGTRHVSPKQQCLQDAVETLKRYPMNLVNWKQTNSHRIDLLPLSKLVREGDEAEGRGYRVDGTVLPIDERFVRYWSDDAWQLDTGVDGKDLATGMPFLLAYHMGRYHGFIKE